jgi:hypothetical protein
MTILSFGSVVGSGVAPAGQKIRLRPMILAVSVISVCPLGDVLSGAGESTVLAEVMASAGVNGVRCGIVWKRPYAPDITKALVSGVQPVSIHRPAVALGLPGAVTLRVDRNPRRSHHGARPNSLTGSIATPRPPTKL